MKVEYLVFIFSISLACCTYTRKTFDDVIELFLITLTRDIC